MGPCARRVVRATIITAEGERFVGTNDCRNPQKTCPRGSMPSGVGYGLCISVCDQDGHAETVALGRAGAKADGADLYLEGHTYLCSSCWKACDAAGIAAIIVAAPPAC